MVEGGRIRALLVDDEPLARDNLRQLLAAHPEVEVVGECGDGAEAVEAVAAHRPDLLFLDVQMPVLDGFGVVEAVGARHLPVVIFVTAYDRYALRAFEVSAVDYLLKPFDDERFEAALERARRRIRDRELEELRRRLTSLATWLRAGGEAAGTPAREGRYLQRLAVRSAGRVLFVDVDDVDWIEAADYYVRLHAGGRSHLVRRSMKSLEEALDPARFLRIHRSVIVRLDRVQEIRSEGRERDVAVLRDGTRLRMSRGRRRRLEEALERRR